MRSQRSSVRTSSEPSGPRGRDCGVQLQVRGGKQLLTSRFFCLMCPSEPLLLPVQGVRADLTARSILSCCCVCLTFAVDLVLAARRAHWVSLKLVSGGLVQPLFSATSSWSPADWFSLGSEVQTGVLCQTRTYSSVPAHHRWRTVDWTFSDTSQRVAAVSHDAEPKSSKNLFFPLPEIYFDSCFEAYLLQG